MLIHVWLIGIQLNLSYATRKCGKSRFFFQLRAICTLKVEDKCPISRLEAQAQVKSSFIQFFQKEKDPVYVGNLGSSPKKKLATRCDFTKEYSRTGRRSSCATVGLGISLIQLLIENSLLQQRHGRQVLAHHQQHGVACGISTTRLQW